MESTQPVVRWLLSVCSWILLGGWFGAFALFALVIAPTAFRVLPSHEIAGDLVAPVLSALHGYGIAAGASLGMLFWLAKRGTLSILLALALAALCGVSEYAVTPAIAAVGARAFGAAMDAEAARRFSDLHQTSRLLFGLVSFGVLVLIGLGAHPGSRTTADGADTRS